MATTTRGQGARAFVRQGDVYAVRFESVGELVDFALDSGTFACEDNRSIYEIWRDLKEGKKFWNGYTVIRMRDELRCPSGDRLEAVRALSDEIALPPPLRPMRRVCVRRPDGDELDPFAWVQRNPDGWIQIERVAQRGPRIMRIGVNLSVPWDAKPEQLLHRGAAAVALADYYTRLGCSVEVVAFDCGGNLWARGGTTLMEIEVKRASEPLDIPMLALALAELAFFRVVVISALHRLSLYKVRDGLSYVMRLPANIRTGFDVVLDSDIRSQADAALFLKHLASKQEVQR